LYSHNIQKKEKEENKEGGERRKKKKRKKEKYNEINTLAERKGVCTYLCMPENLNSECVHTQQTYSKKKRRRMGGGKKKKRKRRTEKMKKLYKEMKREEKGLYTARM
jgi:hypothetical protein